ncbi:MAG TPA: prolyl oligopeptidase family serine peptidase [Caulobacteraceae bacterium]|nr:prolyl oligopeptidase family serine peptidase [Caulobacteraceae bacterium]
MIRRAVLAMLAGSLVAEKLRASEASGALQPPRTARRPLRILQLGRARVDDYAWLKPANWKAVWRDPGRLDPEIRRNLEAEERYASAVMAPAEGLRRALAGEIAAWVTPDVERVVAREGGWTFVARRGPGSVHDRYLRRRDGGGGEEVVLDVAERAAGQAFLSVTNVTVSFDGALFGWAEDRTGAEKRTLFIKDLRTGAVIEGPAEAYGDFAFSSDSRWLLWTWRDADSRPSRIWRRPLAGGADVLVCEEADPAFLLHLSASHSRRYLFARSFNDETSEVRLIDSHAVERPPRLVEPRREGVIYSLEDWGEDFVVLTNDGGAADFKLMRAPRATPSRSHWRPFVAERRGRTLTEIRAFARHLARVERVEGNPTLLVRAVDGAADMPASFDEAAYTVKLQPSAYDDGRLDVMFESPRQPPRSISIDLSTGQPAAAPVGAPPNGRSPDLYEVLRLHAPAPDGARVPITVLRLKARAGAPGPLMLTGYAAYGISYETGFSAPAIALVDRGWTWAVAHARGGAENGRAWFEAARRLGKKLSFSDFIACAEHLGAEGYAAPGWIVSFGYSAGGLLVGASLNMRPDLFAGAIGEAPFVDVLNTMSDATHPLVPLTRPVWGDPLASGADYDNIAAYSPYENIAARPYPPVLAVTAVADDRVGFWEPAKWIARLREKSTSGAPMLLHVAGAGGHAVASAEDQSFGEAAHLYAFAIWAADRHAARRLPRGGRA